MNSKLINFKNSLKDNLKPTDSGFTIIEVVLVLAIAGLIFLMVFVALPALQRSQRNTQREDMVSEIATQLTQYQTNNNGSLPSNASEAQSFYKNYISGNFEDADGSNITVKYEDAAINAATDNINHVVYINRGYKCGSEGAVTSTTHKNDYTVRYQLEEAGVICVDNQSS